MSEIDISSFSFDATEFAQEIVSAAATTTISTPKSQKPLMSTKALSPPSGLSFSPLASQISIPPPPQLNLPETSSSTTRSTTSALKRKSSLISEQSSHSNNTPMKKMDVKKVPMSSNVSSSASSRERAMKVPRTGEIYECTLVKQNGGLGLTLACVEDHVQITGLAQDSPAAGSGIAKGDILVAVGGAPVLGLAFNTIIAKLKSSSRRSVVLKLRRHSRFLRKPLTDSTSVNTSTKSRNTISPHNLKENKNISSILNSKQQKSKNLKFGTLNSNVVSSERWDISQNPIGRSERSLLGTNLWSLKVCQNDRDRYLTDCKRLRKQLADTLHQNQLEKQTLENCIEKMQTVIQSVEKQAEQAGENEGDSIDSLKKRVFGLQAKVREYEVRSARRNAEIASQEIKERRHMNAEAERVKIAIIHMIKNEMGNIRETTPLESTLFHVKMDGIRLCVFNRLFGLANNLLNNAAANQRIKEFRMDLTTTSQILDWSLCEIIHRSSSVGYILKMVGQVSVSYEFDPELLKLSYALDLEYVQKPVGSK